MSCRPSFLGIWMDECDAWPSMRWNWLSCFRITQYRTRCSRGQSS